VVYTLDPNAPLDVARNQITSLNTSPTKSQPSPSPAQFDPLIRVPLQPTVYRNKFLTPTAPIHYESIGHERHIPTHHTHAHDLNSDENSNSITSFTVNLSACQSIIHEEEAPGDIDLHSLGEGGGAKDTTSRGGGGDRTDRMSVSGSAVRNALTRVENEEFRKDDVLFPPPPPFSFSSLPSHL
jgi:hypothetical protein